MRAQLTIPLRVLATLKTVSGHVEPARTRWIDVDRQQGMRKCGGAGCDRFVSGLQITTNRFVTVLIQNTYSPSRQLQHLERRSVLGVIPTAFENISPNRKSI